MENLSNICYFVRWIARHILMLVREFVFRELTWFTATSKDLDNAGFKMRNVTPQHSADLLIFFAICGLFLAFVILSASTPKTEASSYDTSNVETISMAFEEDPSPWYSPSSSTNLRSCSYACGDSSIDSSHEIVPEMQNLSSPRICKKRISPRPRTSSYNMHRSSHPQHLKRRRINDLISQIPEEWLMRRTRSGHIYGKYPTQRE